VTAPALLRQLAQPALNSYANTVTVTVPTRLLTALADLVQAVGTHLEDCCSPEEARIPAHIATAAALAEVERAAKEHTRQ
jgi:hypothetical protein